MLLPAGLTGILEMRTKAEKVKHRDGIMRIGEIEMGDRNVGVEIFRGEKNGELVLQLVLKISKFHSVQLHL